MEKKRKRKARSIGLRDPSGNGGPDAPIEPEPTDAPEAAPEASEPTVEAESTSAAPAPNPALGGEDVGAIQEHVVEGRPTNWKQSKTWVPTGPTRPASADDRAVTEALEEASPERSAEAAAEEAPEDLPDGLRRNENGVLIDEDGIPHDEPDAQPFYTAVDTGIGRVWTVVNCPPPDIEAIRSALKKWGGRKLRDAGVFDGELDCTHHVVFRAELSRAFDLVVERADHTVRQEQAVAPKGVSAGQQSPWLYGDETELKASPAPGLPCDDLWIEKKDSRGERTCESCQGHGGFVCGQCNGKGDVIADAFHECARCRGKGTMGGFFSSETCRACFGNKGSWVRGAGRATCSQCGGSGRLQCQTCMGRGLESSRTVAHLHREVQVTDFEGTSFGPDDKLPEPKENDWKLVHWAALAYNASVHFCAHATEDWEWFEGHDPEVDDFDNSAMMSLASGVSDEMESLGWKEMTFVELGSEEPQSVELHEESRNLGVWQSGISRVRFSDGEKDREVTVIVGDQGRVVERRKRFGV